jgi:WD40 repeat protein
MVQIIDLASGEARTLASAAGAASDLAWSPDGRYLAATSSTSSTNELMVIDIAQDHLVFLSGELDWRRVFYSSISWSPDGTQLAVAYRYGTDSGAPAVFGLWDAASGERLRTNEEIQAYSVDWHPNASAVIATNHPYMEIVYFVDPHTATLLGTLDIEFVYEAKWNRDGTLLAFHRSPVMGSDFMKAEIQIWDVASQAVLNSYSVELPGNFLYDFAWHPVDDRVAFIRETGSLRELMLWDWQGTEEPLALVENVSGMKLAWTPDGSEIAYLDKDEQLSFISIE